MKDHRAHLTRQLQLAFRHSRGTGIMTRDQLKAYQRDTFELFNSNLEDLNKEA